MTSSASERDFLQAGCLGLGFEGCGLATKQREPFATLSDAAKTQWPQAGHGSALSPVSQSRQRPGRPAVGASAQRMGAAMPELNSEGCIMLPDRNTLGGGQD